MLAGMQKVRILLPIIGLLGLNAVANAGALDFYYMHHLQQLRGFSASTSKSAPTRYFNQLIDHNNPSAGTFQQRYYMDEYAGSTHGKTSANSPVIFYICGEAECTSGDLYLEYQLARKFNARLIALEHRYYGKSLPRKTFSTADLQYLSTDQAIEDIAAFQKYIISTYHWTGKWITIGGSYPGSLSAYYRLKHPELTSGSLASSAPVQAKENFEEYDAHVTKVAGPECANQLREVYQQIEKIIPDAEKLGEIKRSFGVGTLKNNTDFLFLVADTASAAVQYGYSDSLCNTLTNSKDPLTSFAKFARNLYSQWGINNPIDLTPQGVESENPANYDSGIGMRQWYYQSCTEYGYWQTANSNPSLSTRSSSINLAYFQEVCMRLFGISTPANTNHINETFYQPLQDHSTSRIFFTNGANDPWSRLSLTAENLNANNPNLNYYTIEGSAHCADLGTAYPGESAGLKEAHAELSQLVQKWLTEG